MRRLGAFSGQLYRQQVLYTRQIPRITPASRPCQRRGPAPFAQLRAFVTPRDPPEPSPETNQSHNASSRSQDSAPDDVDQKATEAHLNTSETSNPLNANSSPSIDLLAQAEAQQDSRERFEGSRDAHKTSIDRRRERFANYGYAAFPGLLLLGFLVLGQNWDDREAQAHADIPNGWAPAQVYARASTRLKEALGYYTEPAFPQLLPDVGPEYRPPYTLVISLEDLMVSSKWSRQNGWEVAKR